MDDAQLDETVIPGQPDHINVTTPTQEFTAGQDSAAITVQVVDQFGNVTPNQDVALASSANAPDFSPAQFLTTDGQTDLQGDVNTGPTGAVSFFYRDTVAGTPNLTFHDNTASEADSPIGDGLLTELVDPAAPYNVNYITVGTLTAGQPDLITLQVIDVYSNPVFESGVTIPLTTTGQAQFFQADGTTPITDANPLITDGNGQATFAYRDDVVGDAPEPTAYISGFSSDRLVGLTVQAPGGTDQTIHFTTPESPIAFSPGETVALDATASSGDPVTFSLDAASTGSGGIDGNVLTINSAGNFVIDANQAGDELYNPAPEVQQTLVVNPGPANQIVVSQDTQNFGAGNDSALITVKVEDQFGNVVPDQDIALSTTSGAGNFFTVGRQTFLNGDVNTGDSGVVSFIYTDTKAASPTLTFHDNTAAVADATLIENINPEPAEIVVAVGSITTITAGQPYAITLQTVDGYINTVADAGATILLTNAGNAQFFQADGVTPIDADHPLVTDADGRATFDIRDYVVGDAPTPMVTLTDSFGDTLPTEPIDGLTVAAGQITLSGGSSPLTAGTLSDPITVQATDANGVALGGETINLRSTGASGQFFHADGVTPVNSDNPLVTDGNGQAVFVYEGNAALLPATLTATDDNLPGAEGQLQEAVVGLASQLIVSTDAEPFVAGGDSNVITLSVADSFGHVLTNQTVEFTTSSRDGAFLSADGVTPITDGQVSTGNAGSVNIYYTDADPGAPRLQFTAGAAFAAQTETVTAGPANQIVVSTDSQVVTAGQNSDQITLEVVDANGNVVPNQDVALSSLSHLIGDSSGQFLSSADGSNLNGDVNTGDSGVATLQFTDTGAGTSVLTFHDNSASVDDAQLNETIVAALPDHINVATLTQEFTAGQYSDLIDVAVVDAYGNVVANQDISLSSSSPAGQFTGTGGGDVNTGESGIVSFQYFDTVAGTPNLVFHDNSASVADAQLSETVDPAQADHFVVTQDSSEFTAGQYSDVVTVKVVDANGNGVADQFVHLGSSSEAGQFFGADENGDVKTDSFGVATFQYYDTVAGTPTLTLHDDTFSVPDATLTETVDPDQAAAYVVTGNQQTFTAGQNSGVITVQVVDRFGNVVSNQDVALGTSSDDGENSTGQFLSSDGKTNLNGDVNTGASGTASFFYTDTLAGTPVLTLTDNTASIGFEQLTETVAAGQADSIALSNPQEFTAGQSSGPQFVQVVDAYGNAVVNQEIHLSSSSGAGQFFNTDPNGNVNTGSSGFAVFEYTDTLAGTPTLTFHDNTSAVPDAQLADTVDPGQASQIIVSTNSHEFTAGQNSSLITVTVEDAFGNIVNNQDVALNTSSSAGRFLSADLPATISDVNTGATGSASFRYTDVVAGTAALTFTVVPPQVVAAPAPAPAPGGQSGTVQSPVVEAQLQETVDPGAPTGFVVTGDMQTLAPGQKSSVITVQVVDSFGNVVRNQNLNLGSDSHSGQFLAADGLTAITSVNTGNSGTASFFYRDAAAGAPTLKIVDVRPPNNLSTQLRETIVAGQASRITFASNPPLTAGVISGAISVQLADANGNPITDGETVNLQTSDGTGRFFSDAGGVTTITRVTTDANGQAAFFYEDSAVGTPKLTATDAALPAATGQLSVSVKAAKLLFIAQPSNVTAGQPDVTSVQVKDQSGNLVTTGVVTLAVAGNPASTVSASIGPDGVAHFSNTLTVARTFSLTASFGPASVSSKSFKVIAAAPAQLSFVGQPANTTAGQAFGVDVKVVDRFGNPASSVPVTIAAGAGPSFTLDDSPSALVATTDGAGVAHFTQLILDATGAYRLTAAVGALTVESSAAGFVVFPAAVGLTPSGVQVNSGVPSLSIGASLGLTGTFIDQGTIGLKALISWGDGLTDTLAVAPQGAFSASHAYTAEGSYAVTVQVIDGAGLVVGVGALSQSVQVLPGNSGTVDVVMGQPGQTVTQTVVDQVAGTTTTTTLTLGAGEAGGDLLAAELQNYIPPATPGVGQAIASFDIRQDNLGDGASAVVTFVVPGTYSSSLAVFYVDPLTHQQTPFSSFQISPGAPGSNTIVVSIFLDSHTTPTLKQAVGTVFTVAASTPSATTTTTNVSAAVASAELNATAPVQATAFQSTSQLTLALATSQASQVSSTRSTLTNASDGGGSGDAVSDDDANALLQYLFDKLEFLPKFFVPRAADGGATSAPTAPAPSTPANSPESFVPPGDEQEQLSALNFFFLDPSPLSVQVGPIGAAASLEEIDGRPRVDPKNPDARHNGLAAYTAASLAGAGLYISRKEGRRKER